MVVNCNSCICGYLTSATARNKVTSKLTVALPYAASLSILRRCTNVRSN